MAVLVAGETSGGGGAPLTFLRRVCTIRRTSCFAAFVAGFLLVAMAGGFFWVIVLEYYRRYRV